MASYQVNDAGVAHCRELIAGRQYVLESDWGAVQPGAGAQNRYLERHSWDEYGAWHLGLTDQPDPHQPIEPGIPLNGPTTSLVIQPP